MVVELKGEHPPLNPNEISNVVYVRTGRRPDRKTVKRVLSEEPIPLRTVRRFEPYREIPEPKERRRAVVALHAEGWAVKAIAGYLKVNRDTVYQTLKRWIEEGEEGLEDRPRGRPKGVGKVDLRVMNEVRKLQENPRLGAFRIRAALCKPLRVLADRTLLSDRGRARCLHAGYRRFAYSVALKKKGRAGKRISSHTQHVPDVWWPGPSIREDYTSAQRGQRQPYLP